MGALTGNAEIIPNIYRGNKTPLGRVYLDYTSPLLHVGELKN